MSDVANKMANLIDELLGAIMLHEVVNNLIKSGNPSDMTQDDWYDLLAMNRSLADQLAYLNELLSLENVGVK